MTELLKFFLPKKMVGKLDFRTLKFEQTVFTDADGNERRADAIISVLSKGRLPLVMELATEGVLSFFKKFLSNMVVCNVPNEDSLQRGHEH